MKKFLLHIVSEVFNYGIGWILGLLATQLVSLFFEERGITNLWGYWSNKVVVQESTLTIIEWLTSAVIGYVVMMQVNRAMEKFRLKQNWENVSSNDKL